MLLGEATAPADTTGVNFIGVWSDIPIGRINIWDPSDGAEGADRIQAWQAGPGGFVFFLDPGEFQAALDANNKVSKGFWDFKPNNVGPNFIAGFDDPLNFQNIPLQDNGVPFWDKMPLDNV